MTTAVAADDLYVTFGGTVALAGARFSIDPGEIVSVMGPSGSGKSTLLYCLAGIVRPDSGRVTFAGQDLTHASERERSALRLRSMGFVFQFGELIPELTLLENVSLPLELTGTKRRDAQKRARVVLDELDVEDASGRRAGEVSGGQAQRAAVARALIHDPVVVFADEPTGALDTTNGELVLEALISAARQRNAAVVLVTHEPRVASFADRDVSVRDGKVRDSVGSR